MSKQLLARLAKLEEASESTELPNGGILIAVMREGETQDQALDRAMARPEIAHLSKTQQRRLVPALLSEADAGA